MDLDRYNRADLEEALGDLDRGSQHFDPQVPPRSLRIVLGRFGELERGLASARRRADDAEAAVERVRALHVAYPAAPVDDPYCSECASEDGWPCPTVRALDQKDTP